MKDFEILVQDVVTNKTFDIRDIVIKPKIEQKLNDGCSKLTFDMAKDNVAKFSNGSVIRFKYNNVGMFFGYVFKKQQKDANTISVTAYDQLRYLKAKDSMTLSGLNIAGIIKKIANTYGLEIGYLEVSDILPDRVEDNKTLLDIIYNAISENLKISGDKYCFYDNFGKLALEDIYNMRTNILIGDTSNCIGYDFTQSIDDDTYNQIKLVSDNKDTKKREVYIAKDTSTIAKWGLLQYYEKIGNNMNYSQIVDKANTLLKTKNREQLKLKLDSIGIETIKAGSGVFVKLQDINDVNINNFFVVSKATHTFDKAYTMSLELLMPSAEVLK